jgi:hypothetical protein
MTPVQKGQKVAWRVFYCVLGLNIGMLVLGFVTAAAGDRGEHMLGYWLSSIPLSGLGLLVGGIVGHFLVPKGGHKAYWLQLFLVTLCTIGVLAFTCGANLALMSA